MKTCPKCGELNGKNATQCYKCKYVLTTETSYKKICPKCKTIHDWKASVCESCGTALTVFANASAEPASQTTSNGNGLFYLVAFVVPLAGFIIGGIYSASEDNDKHVFGLKLIKFTLALYGIGLLLFLLFLLFK